MANIPDFFGNLYFLASVSVVVTLLASFRLYPIILFVVHKKGLMDEPQARSSHTTSVPTLGGIGLFIAFSLTIMLFGLVAGLVRPELLKLIALLAAATVLLIMGVNDDLVIMSPRKKLLGQLFAACVVIFLTDVRITDFAGVLGITAVPYAVSVLFTLFVYILVINALNLIDGIDGLAGSLTILASTVFGTYFLLAGNYLLVLVSFALIGSIIGFLYYNLSNTQKIFMGDSGSMLLGFLLVYQAIGFLGINADASATYTTADAPVLLLAILSFPLFDTLRVFTIRAWHKRSPFTADRNHIHHRLLDLGLAHWQTTLLICGANALVVGLAFLVGDLNINMQLLICVGLGSILYIMPYFMAEKKDLPEYLPKEEVTVIKSSIKGIKVKFSSRNVKQLKVNLEKNDMNKHDFRVTHTIQGEGKDQFKETQPL